MEISSYLTLQTICLNDLIEPHRKCYDIIGLGSRDSFGTVYSSSIHPINELP